MGFDVKIRSKYIYVTINVKCLLCLLCARLQYLKQTHNEITKLYCQWIKINDNAAWFTIAYMYTQWSWTFLGERRKNLHLLIWGLGQDFEKKCSWDSAAEHFSRNFFQGKHRTRKRNVQLNDSTYIRCHIFAQLVALHPPCSLAPQLLLQTSCGWYLQ